jgi:hypothetical protein
MNSTFTAQQDVSFRGTLAVNQDIASVIIMYEAFSVFCESLSGVYLPCKTYYTTQKRLCREKKAASLISHIKPQLFCFFNR